MNSNNNFYQFIEILRDILRFARNKNQFFTYAKYIFLPFTINNFIYSTKEKNHPLDYEPFQAHNAKGTIQLFVLTIQY